MLTVRLVIYVYRKGLSFKRRGYSRKFPSVTMHISQEPTFTGEDSRMNKILANDPDTSGVASTKATVEQKDVSDHTIIEIA